MSAWRDQVTVERSRLAERVKGIQAEIDALQAVIADRRAAMTAMKGIRDEMDLFLATPEA